MTDTETRELCAELGKLTGGKWSDTEKVIRFHKPNGESLVLNRSEMEADNYRFRNSPEAARFSQENEFYPYPDTDYLLDKLPKCYPYRYTNFTNRLRLGLIDGVFWTAGYPHNDDFTVTFSGTADTPRKVLLKLAIELIKQKVITV